MLNNERLNNMSVGYYDVSDHKEHTIDWLASMQQTYEFYKVDPITWKDQELIHSIESCNIERDLSNDTLGSASFTCSEILGECYIRTYLVCNQNGVRFKECLGTHLAQTPHFDFDGKRKSISMDGYTPLIELKNNVPPIGYSLLKTDATHNTDILQTVFDICSKNMRAPVVYPGDSKDLYENFVSNIDDTWFSFCSDLLANAERTFSIEPDGKIRFEKVTEMSSLQPVWVFNDDNSSILLPSINDEADLYNIPNVVEVVYSSESGSFYSKVINNDPSSPVSTVARGREIVHRESNPNVTGVPTQAYIDKYAEQLLSDLSTLKHTVKYSHSYCPVRIGDCILLNYKRAGITNVKAKVISQSISCITGCMVEEAAMYTTKLWR